MPLNRAILEGRYKELASQFVQLGAMLREAAEAMENTGRPLSLTLSEELQSTRRDFEEFCGVIVKSARELSLPSIPPLEDIGDLLTLEPAVLAVCHAVEEAERRAEEERQRKLEEERRAEEARQAATRRAAEIRQPVINMLNRVLAMAHKTRADFAPIVECHARATQLHQTIAGFSGPLAHNEEQLLSEAQTPFKALLHLAEDWNSLDGDDWDNMREEVAGYFGKELAAQAARGQLMFNESANAPSGGSGAANLSSSIQPNLQANQLKADARPFESPLVSASEQAEVPDNAGSTAPTVKSGNSGPLAPTFDWASLSERLNNSGQLTEEPAPAEPAIITAPADSRVADNASWFEKLHASLGAPAEEAAGPVIEKPAQSTPAPLAATAAAKLHEAKAELREQQGEENGSTITQAALSHWSKLLEGLGGQSEAAAPANAPAPPVNTAPAFVAPPVPPPAPPAAENFNHSPKNGSLTGRLSERAAAVTPETSLADLFTELAADSPAPSAPPSAEASLEGMDTEALLAALRQRPLHELSATGNLADNFMDTPSQPRRRQTSGYQQSPDVTVSASIKLELDKTETLPPLEAILNNNGNGNGNGAAPAAAAIPQPPVFVIPPPPPAPPPPMKSQPPATAKLAVRPENEFVEDYQTVPQGFEDEDESEQSRYYLTLEEKHAPFYFAADATQPLYSFQADVTASQIAQAIENGAAPERRNALRDLMWRLLFEEHFGLAFFMARSLERQTPEERSCLPSSLIRAAVLGRVIRYQEGEVAHQLRNDLKFCTPNWFNTPHRDWNRVITLMLAAASGRAALLAPATRAPRTLAQLPECEGLKTLHTYCQTIARHCHNAEPLDPSLNKPNQDQTTWQAEFMALRREVELWWKQAPFREMDFAPATYVWRNWCEPDGSLRSLLPVLLSETCDIPAVRRQIKHWTDERQIRRAINHTDRELIGRSMGQRDIDGDSFKQILDAAREAVDLARRWTALAETRPGSASSGQANQFEPLRQALLPMHAQVLEELDIVARSQASVATLAALNFCRVMVRGVAELLAPESSVSEAEPKVRHMLYAPLLTTQVPVNWRWKPEITDPAVIQQLLLRSMAQGLPNDWRRAFAERSDARDHETTGYIIQFIENDPNKRPLADEMVRERDQQLVNCRAVLRQEIEETRKLITAALDYGYVPEKDFLRVAALIDGMDIPKMLRFGTAHQQLHNIREALHLKRDASMHAVLEKMKLANIGPEHYYYQQIKRVLERGDLVTAEDYLAMVLDNQELPEGEETRDNLTGFYPEKVRELSEYLKQVPLYAIIQRARAGADLCGLRLKDFDLESVAGAISAWFNSRRMQTISEEEINQILPFLGFTKKELEINTDNGNMWLNLTIDTLYGRDRSPVPAYGSEAKGHYRILCVWNRPGEEELLQIIGDTALGHPVIVFYFGQMNDEMRPALARLCRDRRQTIVVLDDVLMLYLYGQRAPRLHTLFECTLPFTWTEPYTATSVPPEMFYGRIQERKSIMSPTGSGFVYGGRRLGKTALLRDVERNFHDAEKGRMAIFLDLEGENIGTQRSLDDLWLLLGEEFKRLKVVSGAYDNAVTLLDQVCDWLEGNQQRRILVMLDQADRFLEADEKEQFVRASRLRGLMEKTNRRFKVVFAGVHNIPRMTRVADHPLAQFGTPISIGPLLGHEAHEARKLIEEPIRALGYIFESSDLIRRILWRTNYFPSLIQHYCNHLLKYLSNPSRPNMNAGPPYFITSEDVDEAYRSQDLRAAIRAGLLLTLQVDERYGVIAYAMADGVMHNGEEALTDGFPVSWVAAQALYWWADGFQSVLAENTLPVILDEMVGLGILRATEKGYTLRSKGVAVLLGNEDQIAAELQRTRKAPQKYNPTTFRAARTGSPRRSPLTAQEMHELRSRQNGISVIFGTEGAGLESLREFLDVATPRGLFVNVEGEKQSGFSKQLNEAIARQQSGTTLLYVPPTCEWDDHWIEEAHQSLNSLTAQNSHVRLAFVADPTKAWQLVNQQSTAFELLPGKNSVTYSLKPWHDDALRQWLDDRDFNIDETGRERVTAVTGNWPMLLEYFYQRSQVDSFHWMEHLRATAKDLKDKHVAQELARSLGLTQAALLGDELIAKRILLALENHGEQSIEELYRRLNQTTNEFPEATIKRVLWWAELLSLANRVGPRWRVDHLVGRVLKAVGG